MKKIFPCLLALTLALTLVLSGCGQDSYTTTLSTDKVADKLLEVLSGRYHGADADYISESRFGANYRDLTEKCYDHIILLSDDEETNIDQIGVFHVINKSDVSGVADAVTSFVEAQHIHTFHRFIHNMLCLVSCLKTFSQDRDRDTAGCQTPSAWPCRWSCREYPGSHSRSPP